MDFHNCYLLATIDLDNISVSFFAAAIVPLGPGSAQSTDDSGNFTLMSMFLIFAVILYLFRPNSLRRSVQSANHKTQPPNDGNVRSTHTHTQSHFSVGFNQLNKRFFVYFQQQDPGSPPIH